MRASTPEPMWRRYLRLFGPNVAADVRDEVADHLARLEADLRAAGTSEADIAAAVRARFGDADAIRARLRRADDRRLRRRLRVEAFGNLGQDVAYALRRLKQRRAFTAAVVIVLALGVGATTAMFSAVDAAMLRPLPFAHPERLALVHDIAIPFDQREFERSGPRFHYPDFNDAVAMRAVFSDVAAYAAGGLNLSDPAHPQRVQVGVVTPSFFATLGIMPSRGRAFSAVEGKPYGAPVTILSDALWRDHFGGRPMLDSVISLNGKPYTVVGVMPRGFSFPSQSELWIPMSNPVTSETFAPFRGYLPAQTIARLARGADIGLATSRLEALWVHSAAEADSSVHTMFRERIDALHASGFVEPLQRSLVGDRRSGLLVLFGATGLLLLIACANVTNLLLSQAAGRRREIALRAVLGATRGRIVRQLLTESIILAVAGTVLGIALAGPVLRVLTAVMPTSLVGLAPATLDWRVLGFAAALALVTGVGFGLWPAFGASRADLSETVKSGGGHGATVGGSGGGRRALVAAELALTMMLLVGAGLMLKSFARLMGVDSGMNPQRVATLEFSFGQDASGRTVRLARLAEMLDRLNAAPGIQVAGAVNDLPLRGGGGISISIVAEGAPPIVPNDRQSWADQQRYARYLIASGGYFGAMGIPLQRGRTFGLSDDSLGPKVAIVNRTMADSLWPGLDPIGRRFALGGTGEPFLTVVGVVSDVRESGLDRAPALQMYFPVAQQAPANLAIVARGTLPPAALLARLRDVVRAVDPSQAVYRVRMMDDVVSASVAPRRTNTLLIALFGALALVLTALGVYAVVAYSVAQRRRELGIRSALGATGRNLVALVSCEMVWVSAVGLGVGLVGAWAASRVMASLLYGVTAHDMTTYMVVPLVLIVPATVATLVPARRAARTNPVDVIREE